MSENLFNILSDFINSKKSLKRKLRVIRYVICIIILYVEFCNSYLDLTRYINLPYPPLFSPELRSFLHSSVKIVFIFCVVCNIFSHVCTQILTEKILDIEISSDKIEHLSYICLLLDFIMTMYFLMYALNIMIEYVNTQEVHIHVPAVFAGIYLIYGILGKLYMSNHIDYEQNRFVTYTGYYDSKNQPILTKSKVIYFGKKYEIDKNGDGVYTLKPWKEREQVFVPIKLEDAASNVEGNLTVLSELYNQQN